MEGDVLKYGWLIVLTLAQIIYVWMRMAGKRNNRKNSNPGNYGVKIGKLETKVKNIEDDIKRIKDKLDLI